MKDSVVVVVTTPLPLRDKTGNVPACFSKTGLKTAVSPVDKRRRKISKDDEWRKEMTVDDRF